MHKLRQADPAKPINQATSDWHKLRKDVLRTRQHILEQTKKHAFIKKQARKQQVHK